jgi:hypothetical protein
VSATENSSEDAESLMGRATEAVLQGDSPLIASDLTASCLVAAELAHDCSSSSSADAASASCCCEDDDSSSALELCGLGDYHHTASASSGDSSGSHEQQQQQQEGEGESDDMQLQLDLCEFENCSADGSTEEEHDISDLFAPMDFLQVHHARSKHSASVQIVTQFNSYAFDGSTSPRQLVGC